MNCTDMQASVEKSRRTGRQRPSYFGSWHELEKKCSIPFSKEVVLEPLLLLVDEDERGSAVLSNISTSDPPG